jgi:23S rRNA (adenine2503-C2)-methyltransferase
MPESTRYGATRAQLQAFFEGGGHPRYRADQTFEGLWTQRRPLDALTNLPKALRADVADAFPYGLTEVVRQVGDGGATIKWLWRGGDGAQVETVLMTYRDRATVCVSSQAGCAMGCTFCATGQAGFERHLSSGEIVEQIMRAQHATPQRVSNVVYMGMGEPLANVDPVLESLERLQADAGFSARHLTVSTVGVVPGIRRLTEFPLPVTLAVSLHAADDARRNELVPLIRRYPLAEVLDAAREYADVKGRRVTFEYACIDGVNDSLDDADRLAALLEGFRGGAHVNLIPLNPTRDFAGDAADPGRIARFAERLNARHVHASIRRNRGVDIDAACGQLRSRSDPMRPSATMEP